VTSDPAFRFRLAARAGRAGRRGLLHRATRVIRGVTAPGAITRLVPVRTLLGGHPWPDRDELVRRFAAYGHSHGARERSCGHSEGSLARVIEAALGGPPVLTSVADDPDFLCGTEFATLADETRFFTERAICVENALIEVRLLPGQLLVFGNLALAHGLRGTREPEELHQRVFGHRSLPVWRQIQVRDHLLDAFATRHHRPDTDAGIARRAATSPWLSSNVAGRDPPRRSGDLACLIRGVLTPRVSTAMNDGSASLTRRCARDGRSVSARP
jgi:hypothetical protein